MIEEKWTPNLNEVNIYCRNNTQLQFHPGSFLCYLPLRGRCHEDFAVFLRVNCAKIISKHLYLYTKCSSSSSRHSFKS